MLAADKGNRGRAAQAVEVVRPPARGLACKSDPLSPKDFSSGEA